ncbi:MAG TPA: SpaA isopeptide-forming pilin-related protein, partial [Thermomicrobiales bacterium]|nr:SpaA isopeptide-forming pilin-related protein [Thermomicrobiales bacterium]
MRARSSRSTSKSTASVKPPGVGRGRSLFFLTALLLIMGMLTPFGTVQQVAAAPEGNPDLAVEGEALQGGPPPLQGVFAVTIGGDVANTVGPVPLSNSGSGIWSGTAPLPPGSYNFDVTVSTNDGDVNAGSSSVDVTPDAAGAVFQFDANNGQISSGPLLVTLQTDFGTFPMVSSGGNFVATFDASPGSPVNVETLVGGTPTGITAQPVAGSGGRVQVVADASGNILQAGGIESGQLQVSKTDDQGNPQVGACFAVTANGGVASQSCDSTDGSNDGNVTLNFPNGVPDSGNLVETFTPNGQDAADSQQISLSPGSNQAQATVEGVGGEEPPPQEEPSEEPTEPQQAATATITLIAVDQNGSPLPGACFSIDGVGQQCDDDQDGLTTFNDVPLGNYNVSSTQAPQGYENVQPTQIDVQGDQQFNVPFQQAAAQTGTIAVVTTDENGQQLQGVCYNLSTFGQQCDGDDDDAVMTQTDVPAGDYTIELIVPDGYQAVGSTQQQVTVQGGETANVTFQVQTAAPSTFTVNITTVDQNGTPLPGACYDMGDAGQACDDDGDGVTTFANVSAGAYNIFQTQAPQGYEAASPQQVDIQSDQQLTFTSAQTEVAPAATDTPEGPVEQPTETPTEEGQQGFSIGLVALDPDNNPVPGACYQLDSGETQCDDDGDGVVTFTGVSAGSHTATMTQA